MSNAAARLLALALVLAPFSGCMTGGGTEIPNEVQGTLYAESGQPAANAEVWLYPVDHVPSDSANAVANAYTARSDASGRFTFKTVAEGEYNLIALGQNASGFQDSLLLGGGRRVTLPGTTLRAPGTLTAKVQLQPQHSPQTAIVQVLGTQYFSNVGANGFFTLTLPRGTYRLRVSSILPEYVPLFVKVPVSSGAHDTLPEPLELFYSGIPVVTGLQATPDSSGVVTVRWKAPPSGGVQAYLVYRDSAGAPAPSTTPYKSVTDTVLKDTLYTTAYPTPAGRFYHLDTAVHRFTYRVSVLDTSNNIGPAFGSIEATPIPPATRYASGRWHRALQDAPFGQRLNPGVVAFNGALWMLGGGVPSIWSSTDGILWQKQADSLPFGLGAASVKVAVQGGKILLLGEAPGRRLLASSTNGTSWTLVQDSLPLPTVHAFLSVRDTLLAIRGRLLPFEPDLQIHRSADGASWSLLPSPAINWNLDPQFGGSIMPVFRDSVWVIGGGNSDGFSKTVVSTPSGGSWSPESTPAPDFLPRIRHAVVAHSGKLWSIGGRHSREKMSNPSPSPDSHAWNSEDGRTWSLSDLHPFPPRDQPAAVSFLGRLWVLGGIQADGTNDIWYYE